MSGVSKPGFGRCQNHTGITLFYPWRHKYRPLQKSWYQKIHITTTFEIETYQGDAKVFILHLCSTYQKMQILENTATVWTEVWKVWLVHFSIGIYKWHPFIFLGKQLIFNRFLSYHIVSRYLHLCRLILKW